MLSDQELARYVESFVRQAAAVPGAVAAAGGISAESVARQLGPQLGLDLTPKAPLIRDILLALFSPPPQGAPFTSSAPSPSASASASASAAAAGHFFSQQQQQQQLQTFLTASQQYQHRGGAGAAAAPPSAYGVAAAAAGYRYGQPFPQDEGAHLQRLVQMHHHQQQQQQQQQQQMAAAAAGVAAAPPTAVESPRPAAASKKESASTGVKRRGGPGGLNKVCGVSPELQAIVGEPTMARTEIVKQLWAYIRRNNLQDPNNKRKIICNDELRLVFETDSTDMFKMNKLLAKHIRPLEAKNSNRDSKKLKPVDSEPISPAETDVNQLPIILSDALASFFGTGEKEMPSSEAVKRVWDHIKSNNLEDPANPTMILCDSKLKQLFGCESLTAVSVSELLSQHLFKQPNKL
ncbi:uncharacterized protein [Oryza sativa Japonica Group]|uniref:uncharacterized protein isoform X2 n=1 Tax=Oryza sativa subsp. japonica TaxID=39947 RepID=UPI0007753670|nr:uncharacterized protein LOC4345963 isoform X2 [Oryza sativa Japonica Group]